MTFLESALLQAEKLQKQPAIACQCGRCDEDQVFTCDTCKQDRPYCMGVADEMPNTCDLCWVINQHKRVKGVCDE